MKHLRRFEYDSIQRTCLSEKTWAHLQAFDEEHAKANKGSTVFDWNHRKTVGTKNWVGVIRIPNLEVEILPKAERPTATPKDAQDTKATARSNLLYMLSVAKKIPLTERDLADLRTRRMPLFEALVAVFAKRLLNELKKGPHRAYNNKEENLHAVKGKILIHENIKRNAAHRERVFVKHDDFSVDTTINRIFKTSCRLLFKKIRTSTTQHLLRRSLLLLDDVSDVEASPHFFDRIVLNRHTERFSVLLEFCRLLLTGRSPTPRSGNTRAFSLLFPMERLFEEFIARFTMKHADKLGLQRDRIHAQAAKHRKWLLRRHPEDKGEFRLKPDLLIETHPGKPMLILDTKWKRLDPTKPHQGVSQSDIYQLYAYAHRYDCPTNILLYPKVHGATATNFSVDCESAKNGKSVRVEMVDVSRDLAGEVDVLVKELSRVFMPGEQ